MTYVSEYYHSKHIVVCYVIVSRHFNHLFFLRNIPKEVDVDRCLGSSNGFLIHVHFFKNEIVVYCHLQ